MGIIPRPYQAKSVKLAVPALMQFMRALVVLATGLGKTITAALIAKKMKARKVLFLVHNNFILDNSLKEFKKVFGDKFRYAIYNSMDETSAETADFVFGSFQMMSRRFKKWSRDHFDLVIVDESHHAQAETYRPVVEWFRCPRLGITATPDRADLLDIRDLFGEEVINVTLEEAIARGWLPEIEYHLITDEGFDEKALKRIAKEVVEDGKRITFAELNRRIFVKARDEQIASIIQSYDEKTLIFCRNISHAENFARYFKSAATFHSETGNTRNRAWERNKAVLESLRKGTLRRVLAVNAFNEGVDVPDIGLVAFNRATESEIIFRQQLGRGLRPGKNKLIVLDFVGNIERVKMLKKIVDTIADLHEKATSKQERSREHYERTPLHLSGKGFNFSFSAQIVDLMKVLERCERDLYPTWQEASKAAQALGIKSSAEHILMYRKDPRLPSWPSRYYKDFPGFDVFYGRQETDKYSTWQQAAKAVQLLGGARNRREYTKIRHKDPRLPGTPKEFYRDFPGWEVFLGTNKYPTWQEAGAAARRLGVTVYETQYRQACEKDWRLPKSPKNVYPNFPGRVVFLGGVEHAKYKTWQEANRVVNRLGIKNYPDYLKRHGEDPRLYAHPETSYKDFPGWTIFCTGKAPKEFYPTWQQASKAAQKLGLMTQPLYKEGYHRDPRLPSSPNITYKNDWPGFTKFYGVKPQYATCVQAIKVARKFGFTSKEDYQSRCKSCDPLLPACPREKYPDFPGWPKYLGKE